MKMLTPEKIRTIYYGNKYLQLASSDWIGETGIEHWKLSNFTGFAVQLVEWLQQENKTALLISHQDFTELKKNFNKCFQKVRAAGGFVFNNQNEMLWIKRKNRWDQPKGKSLKNELHIITAIREVEEETNVQIRDVIYKVGKTFHIYKEGNVFCLKKTHWYQLLAEENVVLQPQVEENIEEVIWVKQKDIESYVEQTYLPIKQLLRVFLQGTDGA